MRGSVAVVAMIAVASTARADEVEMPNFVPTVMDRRWAVSISYGGSTLIVNETPEWLVGFQVAGRFRVRADIELGPTLAAGVTSSTGWGGVFADARYRMRAEMPWDPYLVLGLGGAGVGGAEPGLHFAARAGFGIERRFSNWGISAELQGLAINANPDEMSSFALGSSLLITTAYYWGKPRVRRCEQDFRSRACAQD